MRPSFRSALSSAMLALAACAQVPDAPPAEAPPPACRAVRFEETRFTVCAARPGKHELRLFDRGADGVPLRDFGAVAEALGADADRVAFAMNAGMYDLLGFPIGLYVEGGEEQKPLNRRDGPGNFHLLPNGVFWGDARGWHVAATDGFADAAPKGVRFATQSGPMLVIDGALHPRFAVNGESRHIRNGVGVAANGIAWFAISDEPVSFGRFARLFRDELGCAQALYLDGGVSRLWFPAGGRRDIGVPLGPIVVALETP